MEKIVSVFPVDNFFAVFGDKEEQFKTKVYAFAVVLDDDGFYGYKPITAIDINEGFGFADESTNFLGYISPDGIDLEKSEYLKVYN